MSGKKVTQVCPTMLEIASHREYQISNLSKGACPHTFFEGCAALQHAYLAAYLVQMIHLPHCNENPAYDFLNWLGYFDLSNVPAV